MDRSYLAIYQSNREELESALEENGIYKYIVLNTRVVALYVNENFDERILIDMDIITWWQRSSPMAPLIEVTDNLKGGISATDASQMYFIDNNPYIKASGKNSIIAIIDSGIDYLHPDFINKDRTSKIISIWDQESTKGTPPTDLLFGSEFSREDINKAIRENDNTLSIDRTGTGTIAAGICSGRGNLNTNYKGVAIDSELVVVKLKEYKGRYDSGKINYQTSDFMAAIKYIEEIWLREGKNLIINITLAKSPSPQLELSLLESFDFLNQPGVITVIGAGNEGNTDIHYQGTIKDLDEFQDISIQVGNQENLEIFLYVTGPDKIGVQLIAPSGEISYKIDYSPDYYPYTGRFNVEGTKYEFQYVYPWLETGYEKFFIDLMDVKPGVWTLRINPEFLIEGNYDIYLPNKSLISKETRFLDPSSESTISSYANISRFITVGAYNDIIGSMWIGSSKGSTKEEHMKPDIVASGVDVISTYKNQSYNTGTGTGISSSIVSGVLAVIIDYITEQSEGDEVPLYNQMLKTYLMLGATKKEIYKYPNPIQGYGILNLKDTITQIANTL